MPQNEPVIFAAEVLSCREIHELPGDWSEEDLLALLDDLEIEAEGATGADLMDLVLMGLGDLEPDEAGIKVLGVVFGPKLGAGSRANLAADLEEDRPWEENADLSRQRGVFTAVVLLQKALPRRFGIPDATRAEVAFTARKAEEAERFAQAPPALILRALAPGLGDRSIVSRLYTDGLRGGDFPEAAHILWNCVLRVDPADPCRVVAEICGAQSFLGVLGDAPPWQAGVRFDPVGG